MKGRRPRSGKKRGAILIGVLIILLTITLMGSTLAAFFTSVTTIADVELSRAQALYLAEAGISRALYELHQASLVGGAAPSSYKNVPLGQGTYTVNHDLLSGVITSTGEANGVQRTVQIRYRLY